MSKTLNGNGNGHGVSALAQKLAAKKPATPPNATTADAKASQVTFRNTDNEKSEGVLNHFTRRAATFELYGEARALRVSEVLTDFRIHARGNIIYSGRAVVLNLVDNAIGFICEVDLDETHWTADSNLLSAMLVEGGVESEFQKFEREWQKLYVISPEFKVIVADIETYLHDLQLWLDQVESKISMAGDKQAAGLEKQLAKKIGAITSPKLTAMFEKFEAALRRVEPGSLAVYRAYARRMLHPLLMGSPFLHRTFHKPLGYAGDYEMVNMLSRDPFEGKTLFAKIVNLWFWEQPPAEAHRNRLIYLAKLINTEALRLMPADRSLRVFNFACGPALEIQNFLRDSAASVCNRVAFTLADFNGETLEHIKDSAEAIKTRRGLKTAFAYQKKSVPQLLKDNERARKSPGDREHVYDLVYCAGLFDYLSDRTCKEMMNVFYDFLAPGGLLVATNVDSSNPRIPTMDQVMDWHLIYRNVNEFLDLRPDDSLLENCRVKADATGVNIFLEVRKSDHG